MRIEKLRLHNFRLFADAEFTFPSAFTVLIGENGRGKSAILQALRVAMGTWLLGFKETERLHIQPDDVRRIDLEHRFAPQFPAEVEAWGVVEKTQLAWTRSLSGLKNHTAWAGAKQLVELARAAEHQTNEDLQEIDLPVLGYFGTGRLWVEANQTARLKAKGSKIRDGYARALTPNNHQNAALSWIRATYIRSLKERDNTDIQPATRLLQAVFEAITRCVPGWTDLEWDEDDLAGYYKRPGCDPEFVPLAYLSDGVRAMVGMVAEIAYRCVTLNSHLGTEAVRRSQGIVLIDELDMHLHPNWQRHVVSDLKAAFPNMQFVATTHSPFIVQSLERVEVLDLNELPGSVIPDVRPKDLRLEDVAEDIMDVTSSLSYEKENVRQQTIDYLLHLRRAVDAKLPTDASELKLLEQSIADPGLRALLQMRRLVDTNSTDL